MGSPALAEERAAPRLVPDTKAVLLHDVAPVSRDLAGRIVPPVLAPRPFALPATRARLEAKPYIVSFVQIDAATVRRASLDRTEPLAVPVPVALAQTTSRAGGNYAVLDTLGDHRKVRHRQDALSTALVLRIDGKEESPAFSLGGGGVAAALWRMLPQR